MDMSGSSPTPLPDSLKTKLAVFRRTWYRLHTATLLLLGVLLPAASFLLFVFSDRMWSTPVWMRLGFLLPIPLLLAGLLMPWLRRWVWKKPDAREVARNMGRLDARVGDQLLGAVELSEN